MSGGLAVETRALERTFKGGVKAVRGVDLSVAEGEVFGFLGPNGAGKTTMVRMLCTLLPPTGGTAFVAGVDVVADGPGVRRRIGVALQEIGLDPVQTGRELLELQCGLYGIPGAKAKARTVELLELGRLERCGRPADEDLLGGHEASSRPRQRPRPLAGGALPRRADDGLDPSSRRTIWDEVRRINGSGTTVFLTTQYLEEADQLCDRLAIIDAGTIVAEGTPTQLKSKMGHDVVTLSLDGADAAATEAAVRGLAGLERVVAEPDALALYVLDGAGSIVEIVRLLEAAGIRVGSLTVSRPSLDDVFLRATGRRLEGAKEDRSA